MSDFEIDKSKMAAFGQWLTEQTILREANLFSVCANVKHSSDAVRLEYGKLESFKYILKTFTELYQSDVDKFRKEYLDNDDENQVVSDETEPVEADKVDYTIIERSTIR